MITLKQTALVIFVISVSQLSANFSYDSAWGKRSKMERAAIVTTVAAVGTVARLGVATLRHKAEKNKKNGSTRKTSAKRYERVRNAYQVVPLTEQERSKKGTAALNPVA